MTDFHDVSFPLALGFGARGGPSRAVDITQLASGAEHRSSAHAHARRRYDVGPGLKSKTELQTLIAFFEARRGSLFSFRFRDPLDYQTGEIGAALSMSDEHIGIGDGERTVFQLIKNYSDTAGSYERVITKPVAGTVLTAVNGNAASPLVDALTGQITFTSAPANGAIITAGFQFDVLVRFDMDHLDISLDSFRSGQTAKISLIEVIHHA